MYLARSKKKGGGIHYQLRESVADGQTWTFRTLVEIGPDPSEFLVYPGGNAFHINESIVEKLNSKGVRPDENDLEDIFWPFVRPDIKRAVGHFRTRSLPKKFLSKPTAAEEDEIRRSVPALDKRRAHYLKFGNMDQGASVRIPVAIFRYLTEKSRDEIEQYFIEKEMRLDDTELKSYVYTAFNLQRFFPNPIARKMPHVLDQDRVDMLFIEEICRASRTLFGKDIGLHEYLTRYMVMFFDYEYAGSELLNDYVRDFIYRHRRFGKRPDTGHADVGKACRVFGFEGNELKTMTRRRLTKIFRRLAKECHPDTGGSKKKFVELTDSYQILSREIGIFTNRTENP